MIRLSIITINLNNKKGLEKTLDSVFSQKSQDFEFIVIDGGSDDGSVDLIEKNKERITTWVSEKDAGVYCAMNKGLSKASGKYVLFLNSGDWLVDDKVTSRLENALCQDLDLYYANMPVKGNADIAATEYPRLLDANFFSNGSINHQNCVIKRSLLERYGGYNEKYTIVADWFFCLKAFCEKAAVSQLLDYPIAFYEGGGISTRKKSNQKRLDEIAEAFVEVFGELAPSFQRLYEYNHCTYGSIVNRFGKTGLLDLALSLYYLAARAFSFLRTDRKKP